MEWLNDPIEPMLTTLVDELPKGDYVYEAKWDGIRTLIFLQDGGSGFKRTTIMMLPVNLPSYRKP